SGRPAFTFWAAFVFVLACSAKGYFVLLAPLLFLPDLVDGISWKAIRRKAVFVLGGFVAGAAILAILMANSLAESHFVSLTPSGLGQHLEMQRQFLISGEGRLEMERLSLLPPEGSRAARLQIMFSNIVYVGHVLLKYQGRSFWLLYAASI